MKTHDHTELVDYDGILTRAERERILARLDSLLSWVGESVPETELLEGREVNLRKLVFRFVVDAHITEEDMAEARMLAAALERKERIIEKLIGHSDISEKRAIELLEHASGLLRAIDTLRNLKPGDKPDPLKEALMRKLEDEKRWREFLVGVKTK